MDLEQEAKKINDKWNLKTLMEEVMKTSHPESAPETLRRLGEQDTQLAILKTEQSNIMDKLKENQEKNEKSQVQIMQSLTDFHIQMKETMKQMDEKLDNALAEKAGKWVEKVMVWTGAIIGAGLLAYLGGLLIKLIEM